MLKEFVIEDRQGAENVYNELVNLLRYYQKLQIDVSKYKVGRTKSQNSYYWFLVGDLVEFLEAGDKYKKYIKFGRYKKIPVAWNKKDIHEITKNRYAIKETKNLDLKEFIDYIEKFCSLWIEKTDGGWLPPAAYNEYSGNV